MLSAWEADDWVACTLATVSRSWDGEPTPLQMALAHGHRWLDMLQSGEAKSLGEIATNEGVDSSYVSRMVNLTTLAPLDEMLPAEVTPVDLAVGPRPYGRSSGTELGE